MKSIATTCCCVAVVLGAGVTLSCADQNYPLSPSTRVATSGQHINEPPGQAEPFFKAWDWNGNWRTSPTQSQLPFLDARQYRQLAPAVVDQATRDFASANPGKLYINGDEPDQSCVSPSDYAVRYHSFVTDIRSADPTAHVSPAGFAEYNSACPGAPHAIAYAQQFYDAYSQLYGGAPPVDEWRFHDLGLGSCCNNGADTTAWKDSVSTKAAWSVSHGAHMVLGTWGFADWDAGSGWNEPLSVFLVYLKQMMLFLQRDGRINQAVWCSFEKADQAGCGKHWLDSSGVQTQEGYAYQWYPPAQIPSAASAAGASGGRVRIQWTNTSTDWPIVVEIWVKPSGSITFSLNQQVYVGAGGTNTGYLFFNPGDQVRGKARYYNGATTGEWSAFSNTVLVH